MNDHPIGSVMVVGGGIAGIQSALDLADSGYKVYMVEKSASIGGVMAQLDKTFPTNDCSMCIMSPKLVEVGRHINIELITLAEVVGVSGQKGNFSVHIHQKPRYVDTDKCIACGLCAEKCPKKVVDVYNAEIAKRKAIYVPYPQAVPLKYAIDPDHCIYLQKGKCGACEKKCPAGAVNFDDQPKDLAVNVGAIILAPGFKAFDPSPLVNYAYTITPNVMTSLEFERILSASGPTSGHLARMSDQKEPARIAWLQCVGSRDINRCDNSYCSSVCCMYAIKQAIIAKEHSPAPLDCAVFYMDMRTHGKGFEACYNQAKQAHGIRFVRSRIHTVEPDAATDDLLLRYPGADGQMTSESFDLVVLSVGLEIPEELRSLAAMLDVALTDGGFCQTASFSPVATSKEGIYVCGVMQGPKDIPQSVIEAGSAAMMAGADLADSRNTLTTQIEVPPETEVTGQPPRIGVFVCHCGINIGGVIDVPGLRDYAETLPYVEYADDNLYSCSQDTQDQMSQIIREKQLNRIVVAACSPKTHEPLFQSTLVNAGLNKYLLEFVNIRNQDSWVHRNNPEMATEKAKDLIRMAAGKAALLEPLEESELTVNQRALVIGGGISGMAAAQAFSGQGYKTALIERASQLGGNARHLHRTALDEDIQTELSAMVESVEKDNNIDVYTNAELTEVDGFVGNFRSVVLQDGNEVALDHGVAVVATGGREHEPAEYLYGEDDRVITGLELDRRMNTYDPSLSEIKSAVFIQCVGSRQPDRPYCSRICCTHSIQSAIDLKRRNPATNVYILYRDIRTYGQREALYQQARQLGVVFIRYDLRDKPEVSNENGPLSIDVTDHILAQPITIEADLLVLASAIIANAEDKLARFFKVPIDADGFFVEAHVKLDPSSFATDGVFLCGLAHYPKPVDESIAQAQAAVSSAVKLLSRQTILAGGAVAQINPQLCAACGTCISVCPYGAPAVREDGPFAGKAQINAVLCKGCGACAASCRSGAIRLKGFEDEQIMAMIQGAEPRQAQQTVCTT